MKPRAVDVWNTETCTSGFNNKLSNNINLQSDHPGLSIQLSTCEARHQVAMALLPCVILTFDHCDCTVQHTVKKMNNLGHLQMLSVIVMLGGWAVMLILQSHESFVSVVKAQACYSRPVIERHMLIIGMTFRGGGGGLSIITVTL